MSTFLLTYKHSPENCAMYNEKARKANFELADKSDELEKKYGLNCVGTWIVPFEHLVFEIYEAPSSEAFQKFLMEPEFIQLGAYNTCDVKLVISGEEALEMLKQAK